MNILITGAAGFIGSYLSRRLLARGDNVIGIDNFSDYYAKHAKLFNLDLITYLNSGVVNYTNSDEVDKIATLLSDYDSRLQLNKGGEVSPSRGKFKFKELDIRHYHKLKKLFEGEKIDAVVHLAAMAGVPYSLKRPRLYTAVNIDGTVNLLELTQKYKLRKFVFGSSSTVYGDTDQVPFREDQEVDKPISTYAATKRMGEIICYTYWHLHKIPMVCARIFGPIYGPLQRPYGMAAQKFIRQVDQNLPITIYGDGSMRRDSTYVDDEVEGLIKCLDADLDYEIVNIGTGKTVSVKEMADLTIEYMGKGEITYLPKPPTEVSITYADVTKAKRLLDFEAKTEYREGIKRQIEVYKAMPDWYRELKI